MSGNRSTSAKAKGSNGQEIAIQHHETDAPLMPIEHLERLHRFRPDLVDWVVTQTEEEANYRRAEMQRINKRVFYERMSGQFFATLLGLSGILGGGYVALQGQPYVGSIIASATIGTLALAFVKRSSGR